MTPRLRVTVGEIAQLLGGSVIGDAGTLITGISSLTEAKPGDISFLANQKYAPFLSETRASAVLVAKPENAPALAQVVVPNPDHAFARLVEHYGPPAARVRVGIHPTAVIGENVILGDDVAIGPYVVIGDGARIGDRTMLHPHVVIGAHASIGSDGVLYPQVSIRERCQLGNRVIIHSGAVIGSDGYGYATVQGVHEKIPQVGIVVIEDDVEIGANTTIDRARFDRTRIGRGTKIDNLVQLAHNVETGNHCLIVAQVGIAGSTKLGNHVTVAGQAGVGGHLQIGDQAIVTAMAGVSKSVPPKTVVRGYPAQEIKAAQALEVAVRRLPATQDKVRAMEARITELEKRLEALADRKS
jgi:UDP-3-O-[3-hydroxymyristoyl] glucosamine N-acyltransferase